MKRITWYQSLKSTNNTAREHLDEYDTLSVIACVEQVSGRGQGSHTWYATPGKNLTFTIILKPHNLEAGEALYLTRITTLSLLAYLDGKGVKARIKWPNDIWVGDRKICGILIENILSGPMIHDSIIGIGLNINEKDWPEDLPNPVSLGELTGKEYDIRDELEILCKEFDRHAAMLDTESGREYLRSEFDRNVFRLTAEEDAEVPPRNF